jgi:trimeric autotransporter adhesin
MKTPASSIARNCRSRRRESATQKLLLACLVLVAMLAFSAQAATYTKKSGTTPYSNPSGWLTGVVPTPTDIGEWNVSTGGQASGGLGASTNWLGVRLHDTGNNQSIGNTAGTALTLGASGVECSSAATRTLTLSCGLALGIDQTWTVTGGALVVSRTVNNAGYLLTIAGSGNTTISAVISGTGGLTINRSGSLAMVLSGANTYTGFSTLNSGTVNLAVAENVNTSGPLGKRGAGAWGSIILNGGYLQYSSVNQNDYSGRFDHADNQRYNVDTAGQTVTWGTALVSSGGTLTKIGTGTLYLTRDNTYTGTTTVGGGTLVIGNGALAGAVASSSIVVSNGAALMFDRGDAQTYSAVISGGGSLIKTNTSTLSTLALSGVNTYTGGTYVVRGTLEVGASGGLKGNVSVTNGAVFQADNASAMDSAATLNLETSPSAGTVNLNFAGAQNISALYFGATQKAAGTWGAVGSGAAHQSAAFTGTGILNVATGPSSATALASSAEPAVYGALVLTATVTGTGGTPSGTVTFKEGANVLGTASLSAGVANFNPGNALPPGGPYTLTAEYAGDDNFAPSASGSITQTVTTGALMIKADDKAKDYGDTATLTFTPIGLAPGDTVGSATLTCSQAADTTAVTGSYDIVPSVATGGTFNPANYSITYSNGTLTVNKAGLSIKADDKARPYGGTVGLTFTPTGLKNGETVGLAALTCSQAGDATAPIGSYPISVSSATGGTFDPSNYNLSYVSGTLTVNPAQLTVTGIEALDKVYDGLTNATIVVSNAVLVGAVNADVLTLVTTNATGAFTNKDVGVAKTVQISGLEVYGDMATNYALLQPTTNASITVRTLTVSATGVNRAYDGTTNATATLSDDKVVGDTVTDSYTSASFADKAAGPGKPVTVEGIGISGADAGNYSLSSTTASTTANITPVALTVTGLTAQNKAYDGGTNATLSGTAGLSGVLGSDVVSLAGTAVGAFTDANVGAGKTVNVSGLSLTGADAGNYSLTPLVLAADITAAGSTTALVSSENPSGPGTNVTFTATVSSGAGTPAGDVVFKANAVPFSTNALASGVAATSTASLPLGTNTVTAEFAAQGNYQASSGSVDQVVKLFVTCSQTNALLGIADNLDGTFTLSFVGTPQAEYYVLTSADAAAPMGSWLPLSGSTNTVADPGGAWQIIVTNATPQRFYRSAASLPCP